MLLKSIFNDKLLKIMYITNEVEKNKLDYTQLINIVIFIK